MRICGLQRFSAPSIPNTLKVYFWTIVIILIAIIAVFHGMAYAARRVNHAHAQTSKSASKTERHLSVSPVKSKILQALPRYCEYAPQLSELNIQGKYIVSSCVDRRNRIWIGTEEDGIWRYDPALPEKKRWKQYTLADGLGDNNGYALCCDQLGRVWAGHGRSGLSVFNGAKWKHYDAVDGPLGSHITVLCVSPIDGDVWGVTENGIFRYCLLRNEWKLYTSFAGVSLNCVRTFACPR
jgi:ligand-binding sensor domain-containing protein